MSVVGDGRQQEPQSPSPITLTHTLASLRLAHTQLLEQHSATTALLRQREVELAEPDATYEV